MRHAMIYVVSFVALAWCVFGIYSLVRCGYYAGTPEYWTNSWFWKGHLSLVPIVLCSSIQKALIKGGSHDREICR